MLFPTLSECLTEQRERTPMGKLEAIDAWLALRAEATISVGVIASECSRRCSVQAHGQTFAATRRGADFAASWSAIVAALGLCELYESTTFRDPDSGSV